MDESLPETMRAARVHAPGDAGALRVESVPLPPAGNDDVLVRVESAGLNFIDVYKRSGQYKVPMPSTLGEEGAGVVAQTRGEFAAGDRVAWTNTLGSYAEYVAVPPSRLVRIPDAVSTAQAAAVMLQGMTAHYLAVSTFPLKSGDRCLIHAGAGGVGLLLTQIARMRGAFVITTVGSAEKARLSAEAGAHETIVYTEQDFVAETRRLTGGLGVHVIYDSVGMTTFLLGLDLLVPRGMMVLFGQSSGAVEPLNPQILNAKGSLFLTRPSLGAYVASAEELRWRSGELFSWIERGELSVRIGAEYPLDRVADAHRALEGRKTVGKTLLRV